MKNYLFLLLFFSLCACRPINVTQQYYQEYINPKPSISYEDLDFDNVPDDFLHSYYAMDSQLVRISNKLAIVDNFEQPELWFDADENWLQYFAVFDAHHIFIAGDDLLGFDPVVRNILRDLDQKTSLFKWEANRLLWINSLDREQEEQEYLVLEIDQQAWLALKTTESLFIVVDSTALNNNNLPGEDLISIQKSKKYSGSYKKHQQKIYWIRSMAAENLFYFFIQ